MAARKRRRTSAQTARLAAILLANVAALALLWGLLARPGGELRAAAVGGAAQQARAVLQRREPVLREETLLPRLRAIVRTRLAEAERLSKGRARADSVRVAIHVRELGARGAGLGINVDRAQPPASNMKLHQRFRIHQPVHYGESWRLDGVCGRQWRW